MVPKCESLGTVSSQGAVDEFSLWLEMASDLLALTKSALALLGESERPSFLKPRYTRAFLNPSLEANTSASRGGPWPRKREDHDIYERGDAGHERYANT